MERDIEDIEYSVGETMEARDLEVRIVGVHGVC